MTLEELDEKIRQLESIRDKASGLQRARLTNLIHNLSTKRVQLLTADLVGLEISNDDSEALEEIANTFEQATDQINNATGLIDNAIQLGTKIVDLIS